MKYHKYLLTVVLAAMLPGATLQAQTYNDTVRVNTWSVYGYGGASGFHGLRGASDAGVRSAITPSYSLGVKYNIRPWVRLGLDLGILPIRGLSKGIVTSTTVEEGVTLGSYSDGVRTTKVATLFDNHYQHLVATDLTAELNLLRPLRLDGRWNVWAGGGIGYLAGNNHCVATTATSESIVAKGDDHFNVYGHDIVSTDARDIRVDGIYVPLRFSTEYDIFPLWTIGARAEYNWLPQNHNLTPVGIWSAGVSLAYNFVADVYGREAVVAEYQRAIDNLNDLLAKSVKQEPAPAKPLKEAPKPQPAPKEPVPTYFDVDGDLVDVLVQDNMMIWPVFFELDRWVVRETQMGNVALAARLLHKYPGSRLVIKGYASTEGPLNHN